MGAAVCAWCHEIDGSLLSRLVVACYLQEVHVLHQARTLCAGAIVSMLTDSNDDVLTSPWRRSPRAVASSSRREWSCGLRVLWQLECVLCGWVGFCHHNKIALRVNDTIIFVVTDRNIAVQNVNCTTN